MQWSVAVVTDWQTVPLLLKVAPVTALAGIVLMLVAVVTLRRGGRADRREARWERARREELEAYCRLEVALPVNGEPRKLAEQAKRVCRLAAEKSIFPKIALLLLDAEGRLTWTGSCGMDDLTQAALERWGERLLRDEGAVAEAGKHAGRNSRPSFTVLLGNQDDAGMLPGETHHKVTIVPLRMQRGRLVGLLAAYGAPELSGDLPQALMPLEILAAKLVRTLERAMLMERLMQVERMAGAGHLIAKVAHELTNPLTAVMGFAELIAETASEARIRHDAETIARHAQRMRESLRNLRQFWKPRAQEAAAVKEAPVARDVA